MSLIEVVRGSCFLRDLKYCGFGGEEKAFVGSKFQILDVLDKKLDKLSLEL